MPRSKWTKDLIALIKDFGEAQYKLGTAKQIWEHQIYSRRSSDKFREILNHLELRPDDGR